MTIHLLKERDSAVATSKCGVTLKMRKVEFSSAFTGAQNRVTCVDCGGAPPLNAEEIGEWD